MFRLAPYQSQVTRGRNTDLINLFDDFFRDDFVTRSTFNVDIINEDDNYVFVADLPGVKKESVTVDYKENKLLISVDVNDDKEEKTEQYIRRERRSQSMKRAFLVKDVDFTGITAKLEDGVLTIKAPKLVKKEDSIKIEVQ